MCGIAFIYSNKNFEDCRISIERMTDSISHRGPDERNITELNHSDCKLYFGHTRLSILDLTNAASQPMFDDVSGSYLIYNGEIYNYNEIKIELEKLGYKLKSTGDTEVLLKALLEWGENALIKLRGMFAFIFWNGNKKELLISRDPFGIKPLYYHNSNGYLIAGSEVNTILKSKLCRFHVDPDSAKAFLAYGTVIRPNTIIKGINELQPGSFIIIKKFGQKIIERSYWSLKTGNAQYKITDKNLARELIEDSLNKSVERHLVSDVPVGIFLSGGIDSSLISVYAALKRPDVNLFTVAFSELEFSELKYAFEVAEKIQGNQKIISLTSNDVADYISPFINSMDQPTVDGINTFIISNIARQYNVKVLISGLGGDEVFGGYTSFRNIRLMRKIKFILYPFALLFSKYSRINYSTWSKILSSLKTSNSYEDYLLQRSIRWENNSSPINDYEIPPLNYDILKDFLEIFQSQKLDSDFQSISFMELYFYMSNQLLRDSDVFSMANSIELRVPYLDLDLVTASHSISQNVHIDFFNSKKLLKEILRKKIPYLNINRRKMGFTFPWKIWLQGKLKNSLIQVFEDKSGFEKLNLDYYKGIELLNRFLANDYKISWYQVWSLYILLNWQAKNQLTV